MSKIRRNLYIFLIINFLITVSLLFYIFKNYNLFPSNDTTLSLNIIQKRKIPRILCSITTQPSNTEKVEAVKATWGKRCDLLYFISSEANETVPSMAVNCSKNDHSHLWCKNRQGIMYGVEHYHDQFDWFFKADDDTYTIVENLKYMLSYYDPNEPIWFGCQFALGGDPHMTYMSGGAGYAISREAVYQLNEEFHHKNKCYDLDQGETGADDVIVGRCLMRLGVKLGDSRDQLHRNTFFPFGPGDFVNPTYNVTAALDWFAKYNVFRNKMGFKCCSDTTISFHYVSPTQMYVFDFFLYHMSVHKNR